MSFITTIRQFVKLSYCSVNIWLTGRSADFSLPKRSESGKLKSALLIFTYHLKVDTILHYFGKSVNHFRIRIYFINFCSDRLLKFKQ